MVPSRKRINLENVLAALDTICPKCGHQIKPSETQRINMQEMICPKCGVRFEAGKEASHVSPK